MCEGAKNVLTVTADTLIITGKGELWGLRCVSDGVTAAAVTAYDNTAASGTVVDQLTATTTVASTGGQYGFPIICENGLYLDVTTPARVVVWYTVL